MFKFLCTALITVFISGNIYCQERIATDRPDETETATLVPAKYFQGEFGFAKTDKGNNNYDLVHPTALLKYGLSKNFELRLEENFTTTYEQIIPQPKTTTGLEPTEIGFKAALYEGKKIIPKTSLITHIAIPFLATPEFKANHVAPSFLLVMENDITKITDIGYNLGAAWDGFSSVPTWVYTFCFNVEIGKSFSAYIETFGFFKNDEAAKNYLDGGLCYYISNNVKLDARAGFGVSKQADNSFYGVGISFRFK